MITTEIEAVLDEFARTTEEIISLEQFKKLLNSGRQIRIKYGVDVTAPYLHIGHAVNLWMMRRLQDLGHKVIFLVGDFTTRIGDPTGKNTLRPVIPPEEIEQNARAFIEQARMVLRFDDPNLLEIRFNSEWYNRMPALDLLQLLSEVSHARLISRDMFQNRINQGEDIRMHEIVYPVLQGYDSVVLNSDLTIIGTDQLFNEMLGRFYQEKAGQEPQVIITTRITPGIDGKAKQSKSLGNYIGLGHSPKDKFGRVMRIPDTLVLTYFEVYTDLSRSELEKLPGEIEKDPMSCKLRLAEEIVKRYHGSEAAAQEREAFVKTFSKRQVPAEIPEINLTAGPQRAVDLLKTFFGEAKSNRELERLFSQGAISLNGQTLTRPKEVLIPADNDVWQVGKRAWLRVKLV